MAISVVKIMNNEPVSLSAAYYAFSALQEAIRAAMPEAGGITVKVEPSGSLKVEIVVGGLPSDSVQNQQQIMFKIANNIVAGYRLINATPGFENGKPTGRRAVIVLVDFSHG